MTTIDIIPVGDRSKNCLVWKHKFIEFWCIFEESIMRIESLNVANRLIHCLTLI